MYELTQINILICSELSVNSKTVYNLQSQSSLVVTAIRILDNTASNRDNIQSIMSDNKIYKCGFIADVKNVTLALKFPCLVSVLWKRGEKTAEIKQRKQIQNGVVTYNEKLEIQCNMVFNAKLKKFEEKKTKFTVVILSEKGTKQAGQVYLDVSQLLNEKAKKLPFEKNLQKCPDRHAKLTFQLSGYIKQQITQDDVSMASTRRKKQEIAQVSTIEHQPNFKKKKKQAQIIEQQPARSLIKQKNAIPVTKQNIPKVQSNAIEQQNKKLKENLKQMRELQLENQNLKLQYETQEKKTREYYSKKYQQLKIQYKQYKEKMENIKVLKETKKYLEQQLYENKDRMAGILNFAVLNKKNDLAEELTNIYSADQNM